jgi:hypothetical protein
MSTEPHPIDWVDFALSDILHELKEIKQWVFETHEHHSSFHCADEHHSSFHCTEEAFPYVNSLEAEARLDKLIARLEAEDDD